MRNTWDRYGAVRAFFSYLILFGSFALIFFLVKDMFPNMEDGQWVTLIAGVTMLFFALMYFFNPNRISILGVKQIVRIRGLNGKIGERRGPGGFMYIPWGSRYRSLNLIEGFLPPMTVELPIKTEEGTLNWVIEFIGVRFLANDPGVFWQVNLTSDEDVRNWLVPRFRAAASGALAEFVENNSDERAIERPESRPKISAITKRVFNKAMEPYQVRAIDVPECDINPPRVVIEAAGINVKARADSDAVLAKAQGEVAAQELLVKQMLDVLKEPGGPEYFEGMTRRAIAQTNPTLANQSELITHAVKQFARAILAVRKED